MRVVPLLLCAVALAHAPMQCGRKSDDPELRRYETPPEALYDLAQRFDQAGDEQARDTTLRYIVERYPNSRFAKMATEDLGTAADRHH